VFLQNPNLEDVVTMWVGALTKALCFTKQTLKKYVVIMILHNKKGFLGGF